MCHCPLGCFIAVRVWGLCGVSVVIGVEASLSMYMLTILSFVADNVVTTLRGNAAYDALRVHCLLQLMFF